MLSFDYFKYSSQPPSQVGTYKLPSFIDKETKEKSILCLLQEQVAEAGFKCKGSDFNTLPYQLLIQRRGSLLKSDGIQTSHSSVRNVLPNFVTNILVARMM